MPELDNMSRQCLHGSCGECESEICSCMCHPVSGEISGETITEVAEHITNREPQGN